MATKSALTTAINGFLTAIITILKVKNSLSAMNDTYYGTTVTDSDILEDYTTNGSSGLSYDLKMRKQGGVTTAYLEIENTTGAFVSNVTLFSWKDTEYKPEAATTGAFGLNRSTGLMLTIFITDASITIPGILPAGSKYIYNLTWNNKD